MPATGTVPKQHKFLIIVLDEYMVLGMVIAYPDVAHNLSGDELFGKEHASRFMLPASPNLTPLPTADNLLLSGTQPDEYDEITRGILLSATPLLRAGSLAIRLSGNPEAAALNARYNLDMHGANTLTEATDTTAVTESGRLRAIGDGLVALAIATHYRRTKRASVGESTDTKIGLWDSGTGILARSLSVLTPRNEVQFTHAGIPRSYMGDAYAVSSHLRVATTQKHNGETELEFRRAHVDYILDSDEESKVVATNVRAMPVGINDLLGFARPFLERTDSAFAKLAARH